MTDKWRCLPVALCVLSLACGGKKSEAPTKGASPAVGQPTAAVATPASVPDAPKGAYVTKFRFGSSLRPDGTVLAEARAFGPGETVFASFDIPNAPAGSKVRVTWASLPDKKVVSRQEEALTPDKPAVSFKVDPKGWPLGDYEFVIGLVEAGKDDARTLGSATFKILKDRVK